MQVVNFKGDKRDSFGKKASKDLRKAGKIPAVLYGGAEVVHFTTQHSDVKSLVYTPDLKLAGIEIDGGTHKAILQDIQFHPVTDEIIHMDFLRISEGMSVKIEVPVRFKGESPGVKNGGKLIQNLRKVKIKTASDKLVDELYVDISNVELGGAVRVRDIELTEGIEVINDGGIPVASVEVPRALKSAAAAEEGEVAPEGEAEVAPE